MRDVCKKYFHPWDVTTGVDSGLAGLATVAFIGGIIAMFAIGFVVGLVIVGISIAIGAVSSKDAVTTHYGATDMEYDRAVEEYLSTLKPQALAKLGIDEEEVKEIPPIIMGDYVYPEVNVVTHADGKNEVIVHGELKKGDDWKWRSAEYKVVMLFFSQNELHCYSRTFSTATESVSAETTEVYFYQDVVSASTATFQDKFKDVEGKPITATREGFSLTTKGGTSFTVNVSNAQYAQQSVNAMRALLREKKQG